MKKPVQFRPESTNVPPVRHTQQTGFNLNIYHYEVTNRAAGAITGTHNWQDGRAREVTPIRRVGMEFERVAECKDADSATVESDNYAN